MEIASKLGDKEKLIIGLSGEGYIFQIKGDYEAALEKYEQSLKIAEELGDRAGAASSLHQLGRIYHQQKKYPQALECLLNALSIFTHIQAPDAQIVYNNFKILRDSWGAESFDSAFEKKTGIKWAKWQIEY